MRRDLSGVKIQNAYNRICLRPDAVPHRSLCAFEKDLIAFTNLGFAFAIRTIAKDFQRDHYDHRYESDDDHRLHQSERART